VLGGDPATGCLWVGDPDAGTGQPVRLLTDDAALHVDFTVEPFVVRSGADVLAVEGEPVVLAGGVSNDQPFVEGCPVTGYGFTGIIQAD
jgi:hypothetical protein